MSVHRSYEHPVEYSASARTENSKPGSAGSNTTSSSGSLQEAKKAHTTHISRHKGEGDLCAKGTLCRASFGKNSLQTLTCSILQVQRRRSQPELVEGNSAIKRLHSNWTSTEDQIAFEGQTSTRLPLTMHVSVQVAMTPASPQSTPLDVLHGTLCSHVYSFSYDHV